MKISEALSTIQLGSMQGIASKNQNVYLWPEYGQGKVHKVRPVTRHTGNNGIYRSTPPDDRNDIIMQSELKRELNYTPSGSIKSASSEEPGRLFSALV